MAFSNKSKFLSMEYKALYTMTPAYLTTATPPPYTLYYRHIEWITAARTYCCDHEFVSLHKCYYFCMECSLQTSQSGNLFFKVQLEGQLLKVFPESLKWKSNFLCSSHILPTSSIFSDPIFLYTPKYERYTINTNTGLYLNLDLQSPIAETNQINSLFKKQVLIMYLCYNIYHITPW